MDRKKAQKIIDDPCIMLSATRVSEVKSLLAEAIKEIDQLKEIIKNGPAPQEVGRNNLDGKEDK